MSKLGKMRNQDLRDYANSKKIYLWEVAEEIKLSPSKFSEVLRYELSTKEKEKYFEIIDRLAEEQKTQ